MLFSSSVSVLNIVELEQEMVFSAILYIPEWICLRTNQFNKAVPVHLAHSSTDSFLAMSPTCARIFFFISSDLCLDIILFNVIRTHLNQYIYVPVTVFPLNAYYKICIYSDLVTESYGSRS